MYQIVNDFKSLLNFQETFRSLQVTAHNNTRKRKKTENKRKVNKSSSNIRSINLGAAVI